MEGLKVPLPLVDQIPVLVAPLIVPLNTAFGLLAQTEISLPAFAPGASVIVITTLSVTTTQPPVEVRVNVTVPADVSAVLGT